MYIHIYQTRKYLELGTYNSIHDADIRKKFLGGAGGLSLTQNQREAHMFHLVREEEVLFAEKKFTLS